MGLDRRLQLHEILCGVQGSRNVYFQPPENTVMQYPCIEYNRDTTSFNVSADNTSYLYKQRYLVTLISDDPDNPVFDQMNQLDYCSFSRSYVVSGLTHDTFVLYY